MTDDTTEEELQELREQTDVGTRIQGKRSADDAEAILEDTIVDILGAIDDGEVSKTLSLRDERLTALLRGLEETGNLDDVGNELREELGREHTDEAIDRSEALRLAVRVGLQEAAPDTVEAARDAYARHASERF